jgi:hypothetical protein
MMVSGTATSAPVMLLTATIYSQTTEVGLNVRITDTGAYHVEPHIAAHPKDAHRLLVWGTHVGHGGMVVEAFATSDSVEHGPGPNCPACMI